MSDLLKKFLANLLGEAKSKTAQEAEKLGLTYMRFGRWGKNNTVTHITKNGKLVPVQQVPSVTKPIKVKTTPTRPLVKPTTVDVKKLSGKIPGGKGVLDAVTGKVEVGSAGLGTPESRAAEASVVLISNQLVAGRKNFNGNIDQYLRNNNSAIDSMISELMSLKNSKLTDDWKKNVKAQIVATLSQTEKRYGKIESLVWDNVEGRSSLKLPKKKDMNDRSDLYIKTVSGKVIGVSLKKSGKIFLANQGYSKIIGKVETFAEDEPTKSKIQKLKQLHKSAADASFQELRIFLNKNKSTVAKVLSKFDRTGVKSLVSPKYDEYFSDDGTPTPKFIKKAVSGEKLSTNEFKALLKSLDGVKKENPEIKKVMDTLRDVDIRATKKFLDTIESDKKVREATTKYLLDALDIPQMMSVNPSQGINHVVTVYGEGNLDEQGDPIPMYVDGSSIKKTFGISSSMTEKQALQELRTRFIIDTESDRRVGMIRLRITNKTPPPNYYYPAIATLALRARGLGTAAAFELYQHESWTYTLANQSPNPEDWSSQQRKKYAQSTIKFLQRQVKNALVGKQEREEIKKDIEFYSKIK